MAEIYSTLLSDGSDKAPKVEDMMCTLRTLQTGNILVWDVLNVKTCPVKQRNIYNEWEIYVKMEPKLWKKLFQV